MFTSFLGSILVTFSCIRAPFLVHLGFIFKAKMNYTFPWEHPFFHFFRIGEPNWAPSEAKTPKLSPKESPWTSKDAHKSSQSSTLSTKTDQKRDQGALKDPKDVTKVVTKLKHGGGTGAATGYIRMIFARCSCLG